MFSLLSMTSSSLNNSWSHAMATLVAGGEIKCRRPRIDTPYKTLKNLLATHSAGERERGEAERWRDGGRLPGCSHCVVQSRSFVKTEGGRRGRGCVDQWRVRATFHLLPTALRWSGVWGCGCINSAVSPLFLRYYFCGRYFLHSPRAAAAPNLSRHRARGLAVLGMAVDL